MIFDFAIVTLIVMATFGFMVILADYVLPANFEDNDWDGDY
jgi:hypothetical protein